MNDTKTGQILGKDIAGVNCIYLTSIRQHGIYFLKDALTIGCQQKYLWQTISNNGKMEK